MSKAGGGPFSNLQTAIEERVKVTQPSLRAETLLGPIAAGEGSVAAIRPDVAYKGWPAMDTVFHGNAMKPWRRPGRQPSTFDSGPWPDPCDEHRPHSWTMMLSGDWCRKPACPHRSGGVCRRFFPRNREQARLLQFEPSADYRTPRWRSRPQRRYAGQLLIAAGDLQTKKPGGLRHRA